MGRAFREIVLGAGFTCQFNLGHRLEVATMVENDIMVGFTTLGIVFFLVVILGLQIQISTLTRRIDELIDEIRKK